MFMHTLITSYRSLSPRAPPHLPSTTRPYLDKERTLGTWSLPYMEMEKLSQQGESTVSSLTLRHAEYCDSKDPLKHLRTEFIIPTKSDLKCKTLAESCRQICPLFPAKSCL